MSYSIHSLLRPADVAAILNVSPATLVEWRRVPARRAVPHLPWLKVGRSVRYRRADVLRLMQQRNADGSCRRSSPAGQPSAPDQPLLHIAA